MTQHSCTCMIGRPLKFIIAKLNQVENGAKWLAQNFSSKWTKIADSNYLKVDQNCNLKLANQISKFPQSKRP